PHAESEVSRPRQTANAEAASTIGQYEARTPSKIPPAMPDQKGRASPPASAAKEASPKATPRLSLSAPLPRNQGSQAAAWRTRARGPARAERRSAHAKTRTPLIPEATDEISDAAAIASSPRPTSAFPSAM